MSQSEVRTQDKEARADICVFAGNRRCDKALGFMPRLLKRYISLSAEGAKEKAASLQDALIFYSLNFLGLKAQAILPCRFAAWVDRNCNHTGDNRDNVKIDMLVVVG